MHAQSRHWESTWLHLPGRAHSYFNKSDPLCAHTYITYVNPGTGNQLGCICQAENSYLSQWGPFCAHTYITYVYVCIIQGLRINLAAFARQRTHFSTNRIPRIWYVDSVRQTLSHFQVCVCVCLYMYMAWICTLSESNMWRAPNSLKVCVCVCMHVYIYIYIYIYGMSVQYQNLTRAERSLQTFNIVLCIVLGVFVCSNVCIFVHASEVRHACVCTWQE